MVHRNKYLIPAVEVQLDGGKQAGGSVARSVQSESSLTKTLWDCHGHH